MLSAQKRGDALVKSEFNLRVQQLTGRSKKSVDFKFCNLSAVLAELGYETVAGFAPLRNYQRALAQAAEDFMSERGVRRVTEPTGKATSLVSLRQ